jgi:hypothetical protein
MTELEWSRCANPHAMLAYLMKKQGGAGWPLLSWLSSRRGRDDSRRLLLFAIACCRRVESLLADQRSRYALEIAEKLADGKAGRKERKLAAAAASAAAFDASSPRLSVGGWLAAAQARAAEAVAAALAEHDPANVAAARAKEAVRARAKAVPIQKSKVIATPDSMAPVEITWNSGVIVSASAAESTVPSEEAAWTQEAMIQSCYLRDIFGNPFQPRTINRKPIQQSNAIALARQIYDGRAFHRLPEIADTLARDGIDHPDLLAHCRQAHEHARGCWVIDLLLGL